MNQLMRPKRLLLLAILLLPTGIGGCTAGLNYNPNDKDSAQFNHLVLLDLSDPAQVSRLQADCDRLLSPIEVVRDYACGEPFDTGRGASVDSDYSLGMLVTFDSLDDYSAYLKDPRHLELIKNWKPQLSSIRLFDFESESESESASKDK